jgi:hypothetical protein
MTKTPLVAVVPLLFAACTDDPVSYSAPVGITLQVRSNDVATDGTIALDKMITTESGNPYGKFISDAQQKLGKNPSLIELDSVTLSLDTTKSTNVTLLEQIMIGESRTSFVLNDTDTVIDAARFTNPTSAGPFNGTATFDMTPLAEADVEKLLGGSFKVQLNAAAAPELASTDADAVLQLTFTFSAYE